MKYYTVNQIIEMGDLAEKEVKELNLPEDLSLLFIKYGIVQIGDLIQLHEKGMQLEYLEQFRSGKCLERKYGIKQFVLDKLELHEVNDYGILETLSAIQLYELLGYKYSEYDYRDFRRIYCELVKAGIVFKNSENKLLCETGISFRAENALIRSGYLRLSDLDNKRLTDLLVIRNVGESCINQLLELLYKTSYVLKDDKYGSYE